MLTSYKKLKINNNNIPNRRSFSRLTQITDFCKDHPYIVGGNIIILTGLTEYAYYDYNNQLSIYNNSLDSMLDNVQPKLDVIPKKIDTFLHENTIMSEGLKKELKHKILCQYQPILSNMVLT